MNHKNTRQVDIPLFLNEEVFSVKKAKVITSHDKTLQLGNFSISTASNIKRAIEVALNAAKEWRTWSIEDRAKIFIKAATLLSTEYRSILNAATMLEQSKNIYQSEIDAICELCDFWRFQSYYALNLYKHMKLLSPNRILNQFNYKPLEGFVYAISPFNFISLAANLATAPALMGNVVIWKPASTAMLSSYYIMKILKKAELPPGVITLVSGDSRQISNIVMSHKYFSGIHFTGSTVVFNRLWSTIANNLNQGMYKNYPRIVEETGGKDFVLAYKDADLESLCTALIRGAYKYQGQKCSAASRAYIPKSIWSKLKEMLIDTIKPIKVGDISNFTTFMGTAINENTFNRIKSYIDYG